MRAAIYLRQSIDNSEGIDRQRTRTKQLVKLRGWKLVGEYADNDTSASKRRGEGTDWARMLASDAEVVVAVDLDRLLRDVRDLSTLIDTGKKVVTVDGEIDLSTADGEFRATMLAGIARFEVRRKSERQVRANDTRARAGKWVGGRRPFGFEADGMTVREVEAEAIRDGFAAYIAGSSLSDLARDWNARGLRTGQMRRNGKRDENGKPIEPTPWERTAVRAVLTNPRYVGKVRYNGEIVADAAWPALVDRDTWEAVQRLVNGARGRTTNARALLTGVARCGVAGCEATVHGGGNARKDVRGYRCSGSLGHFARMAEPIEEYVDRIVAARLDRPDAANLLHAADTSPEDQALLDSLQVQLDAVPVDFADGILTREQVPVVTKRLRERIAEVQGRMADAARERVLSPLIGNGERYRALPVEQRRQVIDVLMEVRILPPGRGTRTFRPESVEIAWR